MNDTIAKSMREILEAESRAILAIPVTEDYARAVEAIVERVHRRGGKLVTSGMGKAGQIAMNIATTFSSTGTPAVNLHPSEAQHGDLGVVQPNDIMLLISNSGKTREILELIELLRRLYPAGVSKDNIRAHLGALQNRLENTVANLSIQAENLQASESRISDVDVATEMTNFVRNQTLANAANSMLGQANSLPQMALSLIR